MTGPTLDEARKIDDVIEEARAEEALAERRTALRDRMAALDPSGRETLRAFVDLAGYADAAYRANPEDVDDREAALDLIDEAEAYASGQTSTGGGSGLVQGHRHDLGTDFRGLTATADGLVQHLSHAEPAAQVWVIVRVAGVEHMAALDGLRVTEDGVVHLLGPGAAL